MNVSKKAKKKLRKNMRKIAEKKGFSIHALNDMKLKWNDYRVNGDKFTNLYGN